MEANKIRILTGHSPSLLKEIKSVIWMLIAFAALFAPGVIAQIPAMQWAGFVVLLSFLATAFNGYFYNTMTIDEARQKLDQLEEQNNSMPRILGKNTGRIQTGTGGGQTRVKPPSK